MSVEIGEVTSTIRTVDGESLLDPRTLKAIVELVLKALDERELHDRRAAAERGVPRGVARQQDQGT